MFLFVISLAAAAQGPVAQPVDADSKLVCKRISRTGSRMPAQRICMTGADWRLQANSTQREVTDLRTRSQMEHVPSF